jgi:hypothetical protein
VTQQVLAPVGELLRPLAVLQVAEMPAAGPVMAGPWGWRVVPGCVMPGAGLATGPAELAGPAGPVLPSHAVLELGGLLESGHYLPQS